MGRTQSRLGGGAVLIESKPAIKSKLNWTGAVLTAIGVLQAIQTVPELQEYAGYISGLAGILVILFRTFGTDRPVTLTTKPEAVTVTKKDE